MGQELAFEEEDVFDWVVNQNGCMHGGFTMRVARSRLSAEAQRDFDRQAGITQWLESPVD